VHFLLGHISNPGIGSGVAVCECCVRLEDGLCNDFELHFAAQNLRGRRAPQTRLTKNLSPIRCALWGKHFECFAALAEIL
jgi:hypothetical protein